MSDDLRPPFTGSFPVPNSLVDAMLPDLKDTEIRVLLVVLRQTWGWRDPKTGRPKARDWLTHGRLKRLTGRASEAVSAAVDALVKRGLIVVEDVSRRALATPAERRRSACALYFRPGPQLAGAAAPETGPPVVSPDGTTEIRKAKTTNNTYDNNHIAFRKAGHGASASGRPPERHAPPRARQPFWPSNVEPSLTQEQTAAIEATRKQIRARLVRLRGSVCHGTPDSQ